MTSPMAASAMTLIHYQNPTWFVGNSNIIFTNRTNENGLNFWIIDIVSTNHISPIKILFHSLHSTSSSIFVLFHDGLLILSSSRHYSLGTYAFIWFFFRLIFTLTLCMLINCLESLSFTLFLCFLLFISGPSDLEGSGCSTRNR